MKNCIEKLKFQIYWRTKLALLKLKYPKAGYYTRLVLANGASLSEIDEWTQKSIDEYEKGTFIHVMREDTCEIEVSYWEP